MQYPHIGAEPAAALMTMIAFGLIFPIGMLIFWKIKSKQPISVFICGAVIFFVFAGLLESGLLGVLTAFVKPFAKLMEDSTPAYVAIGALAAGLFEETGRWLAFKKFLKKHTDRDASIAYGIGHGGFEAMFVLVLSSASMLMYTVMINSGQFGTLVDQIAATNPDQVETIKAIPDQIAAMSMTSVIPGLVERISAMMIHISLSMIVFCGARIKGKGYMYPLAILLHALIDVPAAMYQKGVITNIVVFEICFFAASAVMLVLAYRIVYKGMMSGLVTERKGEEDFPMYVEKDPETPDNG